MFGAALPVVGVYFMKFGRNGSVLTFGGAKRKDWVSLTIRTLAQGQFESVQGK
jgi:hypothetical protein